ncbi:hypothetical protein [Streptomyces microflavus]|uniref:hypothetical protein n=1 Tax=Streptomyces microflavus TaxID=1919 RepID=UPI003820CF78
MSHDYVAILISVDAALLLVGTIQYGTASRRVLAASAKKAAARTLRLGLLIQQQRDGRPPTEAQLLEARRADPRARPVRSMAFIFPGILGSGIYMVWCGVLGWSMIEMLMWAGQKNGGDAPELAKTAFVYTAGSLIFLVLEAYVLAHLDSFQAAVVIRNGLQEIYETRGAETLLSPAGVLPPTGRTAAPSSASHEPSVQVGPPPPEG